jgi:hypothetical protein
VYKPPYEVTRKFRLADLTILIQNY